MIEINAYKALGLHPYDELGRWERLDPSDIRGVYVQRFGDAHPELNAKPDGDLVDLVRAADLLLSPGREAHDLAIQRGDLYRFEPELASYEMTDDPVPYLVSLALHHGCGEDVADVLPDFIDAGRLESLELLGLAEAWEQALDDLAVEDDDDPRAERYGDLRAWVLGCSPVQVVFRAKTWASLGVTVDAKPSKIPPDVRAKMSGPLKGRPTHRITINLRSWLECGPQDRARLVLGALLEFAPKWNGKAWRVTFAAPDIREQALVLRRYGVRGTAQAEAVVAAAAREDFPAAVKTWEAHYDEQGRGFLFEKLMVPR